MIFIVMICYDSLDIEDLVFYTPFVKTYSSTKWHTHICYIFQQYRGMVRYGLHKDLKNFSDNIIVSSFASIVL